jgi:hypothetical protein
MARRRPVGRVRWGGGPRCSRWQAWRLRQRPRARRRPCRRGSRPRRRSTRSEPARWRARRRRPSRAGDRPELGRRRRGETLATRREAGGKGMESGRRREGTDAASTGESAEKRAWQNFTFFFRDRSPFGFGWLGQVSQTKKTTCLAQLYFKFWAQKIPTFINHK